jgi:KDO2-lipid IV(A) lauroyltransferase
MRFLNPIWTRLETRYLAERVVIDPQSSPAAARQVLQQRLHENAIVSITVGDQGRRIVEVPCLAGYFRIATGPINLALRTGAQLAPLFAVRDESGHFKITVDPPLDLTTKRDQDGCYQAVAQEYAKRLEPYVRAHPDQWNGWRAPSR